MFRRKKSTKEEIRKELFEGVCKCVEEIQDWEIYGFMYGIKFIGERPLSFKPGTSDKMLFNKMIDEVIDNISYELNETKTYTCGDIMGVSIMSRYYYPYYSWCDERELNNARNNTNL